MQKLLTSGGTTVAVLLALAVRGTALDCMPRGVEEEFRGSAAVFSGRVTAVDATNGLTTIRITTTWKGTARGDVAVRFDPKWGPAFRVGVDFLVYGTGTDGLRVGTCSRTRPLAAAEEDLVFLTGDAAAARQIRAAAVGVGRAVADPRVPAPVAPQPPAVPAGVTIVLQHDGQVIAAVHKSGKTVWQVMVPAAATAVRVEGSRVIVEPAGLVLDLASGKPVPGPSADEEAMARTQAEEWVQANGRSDWGEIAEVEDRGDVWLVRFTRILKHGTPVQRPAAVWVDKQTGRTREVEGE